MLIKNRITLVYTLIVTIILSVLCTAIYVFSYTSRVEQFKDRLKRKALSTAVLIKSNEIGPDLIKEMVASDIDLFKKDKHLISGGFKIKNSIER